MMLQHLPTTMAIVITLGSAAWAAESDVEAREPLSVIELRIGRTLYGRYLPQEQIIVTHDPETGRARGVYRVQPGDVLTVRGERSLPENPGPARPAVVVPDESAEPAPEEDQVSSAAELLAQAQTVAAALEGALATSVDHDAVGDLHRLAGDLKQRRAEMLDTFQALIAAKRSADAASLPDLSGVFTQLGDVVAGRSRHMDELIAVVETFTRYSELTRRRMEAVDRRFVAKDQEARQGLSGLLAAATARHGPSDE